MKNKVLLLSFLLLVPLMVMFIKPIAALPAYPLLKVMSTSLSADVYGVYNKDFYVNVWVMGADYGALNPFWDVAGFDFKVTYNPSLLTGLDAKCDPTGWFASFWPGGVFTVENGTDPSGLAWFAFLGIPSTSGTHTPVNGKGIVASIHFKAISPPTPPVGPTCLLHIASCTVAGFPHPERSYPPWNGGPYSVQLPVGLEDATYHSQPYALVGGEWAPVNTALLLAPWIALGLIVLAGAAAASYRLYKKRW
jgi:hypothetical protein